MNKTTLYIGLNDKDTKTQKIDTIEAFKIVSNIITEYADGGTIYQASGIYKHYDGSIVIENTLRVELIDAGADAINSIIKIVKTVLNQESVIKQTETITSEFC